VACGSDPVDLTGVYRVDTALGSEPCGSDGAIQYPMFLRFERGAIFGQTVYQLSGCGDEQGQVCTPMGGLFETFAEPIDDGWRGETIYTDGDATTCVLGFNRKTAILRGAALDLEESAFEELAPELVGAACTPAEAEQRNTAMPCVEHTVVTATKL
jgi:hypothetical protein